MINIYPAIDLSNKKVVRLIKGDYNQKKEYSNNPIEVVEDFISKGATNLHIVDLDGAKIGSLQNLEVIENIIRKYPALFVQVGGGIRSLETIKKYIDIGVSRIILGTKAVTDLEFLKEALKLYKDKIAVSIDEINRKVKTDGWINETNIDSIDFCIKLKKLGISTIIYTDISKDGLLNGTNIDIYKELKNKIDINIIASGGITYLDEIVKLNNLNIYGAIIGKALYENKINLEEVYKEIRK